jgi:hypothetical protein
MQLKIANCKLQSLVLLIINIETLYRKNKKKMNFFYRRFGSFASKRKKSSSNTTTQNDWSNTFWVCFGSLKIGSLLKSLKIKKDKEVENQ